MTPNNVVLTFSYKGAVARQILCKLKIIHIVDVCYSGTIYCIAKFIYNTPAKSLIQ